MEYFEDREVREEITSLDRLRQIIREGNRLFLIQYFEPGSSIGNSNGIKGVWKGIVKKIDDFMGQKTIIFEDVYINTTINGDGDWVRDSALSNNEKIVMFTTFPGRARGFKIYFSPRENFVYHSMKSLGEPATGAAGGKRKRQKKSQRKSRKKKQSKSQRNKKV